MVIWRMELIRWAFYGRLLCCLIDGQYDIITHLVQSQVTKGVLIF